MRAQMGRSSLTLWLLVVLCSLCNTVASLNLITDKCSYSHDFISSSYHLEPKQEVIIGKIPNEQRQILMLKSNQEVHFKLMDDEGSILLNSLNNNIESLILHEGMKLSTCVGKCESKVVKVLYKKTLFLHFHILYYVHKLTYHPLSITYVILAWFGKFSNSHSPHMMISSCKTRKTIKYLSGSTLISPVAL